MISLFKKKKLTETTSAPAENTVPKKTSFFQKLKASLQKTQQTLSAPLHFLLQKNKAINPELFHELECTLLAADLSFDATQHILAALQKKASADKLQEASQLYPALKAILIEMLEPIETNFEHLIANRDTNLPFSFLFVGINGAGKTTTLAKLCKKLQSQSSKTLLVAGDTFRAAATEQLGHFAEQLSIDLLSASSAQKDSSALVYQGTAKAIEASYDYLLIDTAGRLHTTHNLVDELKKIKRVMQKQNPAMPHNIWLILDGQNGQNAIRQAQAFHEALSLTGLIITKLDGSAKAGAIFNIAQELALPVFFVGVGEDLDDLQPFNAQIFVDALLNE